MPIKPNVQPAQRKNSKPWFKFWVVIFLTLVTIYYNIPHTSVNWNIFGRQIDQIGGYDICIPSWNFQENTFQCPTTRQMDIQLGLDLQGGMQLTLDTDMSKISQEDKESALESARQVIERRVNMYGVSEPVVQASRPVQNSC